MSRRPWSLTLLALLLLGCLMTTSGCRRPQPPTLRSGWVQLSALTPLHPSQGMVADLNRRIATLEAQRAQTPNTPVALPPAAITEVTPLLSSLPEPMSSPRTNNTDQQLLAQEMAAFERVLSRSWARKWNQVRDTVAQRIDPTFEQNRQRYLKEAETARSEIYEEFQGPLMNARLSLQVAQSWANRQGIPVAERVHRLQQEYDDLSQRYQAKLEQVDADLASKIATAKARSTAANDTELARMDEILASEYDQKIRERKTQLATETVWRPVASAPPPMPFPEISEGTLTLETPGLQSHFASSTAAQQHDVILANQDLDATIAKLRMQRDALLAQITRDTQRMTEALAAQHGYRLADRGSGADLSADMRKWLRDYWSP